MTVATLCVNLGLPLPFVAELFGDIEGPPEPEISRCLCRTEGPWSALDESDGLAFMGCLLPVDFRRRSKERSEKPIPGP